jgi:hypothetical protein
MSRFCVRTILYVVLCTEYSVPNSCHTSGRSPRNAKWETIRFEIGGGEALNSGNTNQIASWGPLSAHLMVLVDAWPIKDFNPFSENSPDKYESDRTPQPSYLGHIVSISARSLLPRMGNNRGPWKSNWPDPLFALHMLSRVLRVSPGLFPSLSVPREYPWSYESKAFYCSWTLTLVPEGPR